MNRYSFMFYIAIITYMIFAELSYAAAVEQTAAAYIGSTEGTPLYQPQKLTLTQAAILGVVEGLTEYLPVSSTGHLILACHFMGLVQYSGQSTPFGKLIDKNKMEAINSFDIVIQLGAILAIIGLYRKRIGQMSAGIVGKNPQGFRLLMLLVIAFLPAAIVGILLHETIEAYLFGPIPVAWALAAGGILMIVIEYFYYHKSTAARVTNLDFVSYRQALIIGIAQILSMWPGTSRSMITILAALLVGLDMLVAAEFSFLLALPTLVGATVISAAEDWHVLKEAAGIDGMLVGLVVSGIVAALAVKGFVKWLTRHGLTPFGIYRLITAAVVFLLLTH